MPTLNVVTKIIAFGDEQVNSNPRLRYVDWLRDMSGMTVADPRAEAHRLEVGGSKTIFDGSRATTIGSSTEFSIALLSIGGGSRYRITWTGGTNPTLRTGRGLTPSGANFTFTVNPNATVTLESDIAMFGSVVAGDSVFIPHTTTGDTANVINVLNSGYWQVLGVPDTSKLVLVRPAGVPFSAFGETVLLTSNTQFRAFSAAGVQVGDSVDISAGFSTATQHTYPVVAVTDLFVEILSTLPLPSEDGILPGTSGMVFYQEVKTFLYLESSQEVAVRLNGDTTNRNRLTPFDPSDPNRPGAFMKHGPVWLLVVVNLSGNAADITAIHAEE